MSFGGCRRASWPTRPPMGRRRRQSCRPGRARPRRACRLHHHQPVLVPVRMRWPLSWTPLPPQRARGLACKLAAACKHQRPNSSAPTPAWRRQQTECMWHYHMATWPKPTGAVSALAERPASPLADEAQCQRRQERQRPGSHAARRGTAVAMRRRACNWDHAALDVERLEAEPRHCAARRHCARRHCGVCGPAMHLISWHIIWHVAPTARATCHSM